MMNRAGRSAWSGCSFMAHVELRGGVGRERVPCFNSGVVSCNLRRSLQGNADAWDPTGRASNGAKAEVSASDGGPHVGPTRNRLVASLRCAI